MEVTPTQLIALLREGTAPLKVRAAIARGTLPLPPATLLESLDILADDPDTAVQAAGAGQLRAAAGHGRARGRFLRALRAGAARPACPSLPAERRRSLLDIARNAAADDATLAFIASLPFPAALEVIGRNQERLERSPEIVAALLANPATPASDRAPLAGARGARRRRAGLGGGRGGQAPAEEEAPTFEPVLVEEEEKDDEAAGCAPSRSRPTTRSAPSSSRSTRCSRRCRWARRCALATKGNREVRNLLIRENNKMLCLKVLENPRLGESDVEAYAKSTNISVDVLRGIANQKEW